MSSAPEVPDGSEPSSGDTEADLAGALASRLPVPEGSTPKDTAARSLGSSFAGRALIGWMTEDEAALTLASRRQDQADNESFRAQARAASAAVAARPAGIDQEALVESAPAELTAHIHALAHEQLSAPFFAEGWEIKIVDLSRVCSLQPTVRSEQASARVASIDPDDVEEIAAVTLPIGLSEDDIPIQFDEERRTWLISAANPNLKLAGHFSGRVQEGAPLSFGFNVAVMPSYLQVVRHHGRYVLRDGYHRAFGLLRRGIYRVPAFVRDFGVASLGVGPGLFGTDVYLSERPPLLADFLNDDVAADAPIPSVQKMVVIQGLELTPLA